MPDDTADQLDDGAVDDGALDADDLDTDGLDPGDLDERDLDDGRVRPGGRSSGDTMLGAPVARPRPATMGSATSRTTPRQFLHEVNVELRKVAWPTRRETINYSVVVFVTLAVLMSMIFGFDYGFNRLSLYLFK